MCTKNGSQIASGNGASVANGVTLGPADGDVIVCTFTNTFVKLDATLTTTVKDGSGAPVTDQNPAALGLADRLLETISAGVASRRAA